MAWDSTKSAPRAQQPEPSTQCPIPGGDPQAGAERREPGRAPRATAEGEVGYGPPVASPMVQSRSLADSVQTSKVPKSQLPAEQVYGSDR